MWLYFGLDLSEPDNSGFVFDPNNVTVRSENDTIFVTVNRTSHTPFLERLRDGPPGWGMLRPIGKVKDYNDGSEYRVIINEGKNLHETVVFRYDGSFLAASRTAPVNNVKIESNGSEIYAAAEIWTENPLFETVDEQNVTVLKNDSNNTWTVYIPFCSSDETGHSAQNLTYSVFIGNSETLEDGRYSVMINGKEAEFDIIGGRIEIPEYSAGFA
ncbi:hypothetical protein MmiAt1_08630 [Methanimicrococcus sp. At1]|uniref:Uncharacterized protein n=1 Tax=Methanimicrococcus hacksteinii TaxID=3028293 RepID=A0ABU3VPR3_9EURY|nr:hypothetical protein [Methanimicrococcus sp. At1]MDV0445295.1 hypothetical protein [Methanimicrococcus sp. At1]